MNPRRNPRRIPSRKARVTSSVSLLSPMDHPTLARVQRSTRTAKKKPAFAGLDGRRVSHHHAPRPVAPEVSIDQVRRDGVFVARVRGHLEASPSTRVEAAFAQEPGDSLTADPTPLATKLVHDPRTAVARPAPGVERL